MPAELKGDMAELVADPAQVLGVLKLFDIDYYDTSLREKSWQHEPSRAISSRAALPVHFAHKLA